MDPTEIIAVPIPLSRLSNFVGFSVLFLFVVSVPWWELAALWRKLKVLTATTFTMLAITITCGTHPADNLLYTTLASFYVASLVSLNPPVFGDANGWGPQQALFNNTSATHRQGGDDTMGTTRLYTTLLVTIPFQILNILDSGLQVQRWPLPIVLGSTAGWITGSVLGLLWALYTNSNATTGSEPVDSESSAQDHQKKDRYNI